MTNGSLTAPARLREQGLPGRVAMELPAWPVLAVLWGYPLFWAVGLLAFSTPIMAVVMLAYLVLRRHVTLVPGLLPWIGFVLWMIPTAAMVDTLGQMLGLVIRFSQFAAIAVIMVYIVNAREALTPRRLLDGLTFVWVFLIVGGYLGMLFPYTRLTLTIGRLIPDVFLQNDYVADLAFPGFAEIQTPWGAAEPFVRPSAPFAYTNGWGAAFAVLTPIVVANTLSHRTARGAWLLAFGVVAAVPPAVATTNRGLFVGLALAIGYVLLRLLIRGRWLPFLWVGSLSVVVTLLLTLSGLLDRIAERQDTVDTTQGRLSLYVETFERTLASPVLGWGAPRPSFSSEIYVGTQGAVWNVMFCFGFVGLVLFGVFLLSAALRTARAPNLATIWAHTSVVVAAGLSLFYGLDRQLLFVGIVVALMLRERFASGSTWWTPRPVPFWNRSDGA